MVAWIALFLALAAASLAVFDCYFLYRIEALILKMQADIPSLDPDKYAADPLNLPRIGLAIKEIPDMDITGAWALEQEQAGIGVSKEEIDLFRRMRMEAGL